MCMAYSWFGSLFMILFVVCDFATPYIITSWFPPILVGDLSGSRRRPFWLSSSHGSLVPLPVFFVGPVSFAGSHLLMVL
ncbi:hypothetical protein U1Q18_048094 [Sarracenia purpurea var. burkii]